MQRTILHSDINNCFASIECMHNPSLYGKPVAVGGSEQARHGIILAKTYEAKAFGVTTGEPLWQARRKCPGLVIVPPHFDLYEEVSQKTREIYAQYTDMVEPFGMDEAWMDITGCTGRRNGEDVANEIRARIKQELGITVSVGVGDNKIFAKMGSDLKKPDAVTLIDRKNYKQKLWPLPVRAMLFVGPATENKLFKYGIKTIGELANTDPEILTEWFGKSGKTLHLYANGLDRSPVCRIGEEPPPKSIGNSTTTPRDLENEEDISIMLLALSDRVASRLRKVKAAARTVQIWVRDSSLSHFERQMRMDRPTNLAPELCAAGMALFRAEKYDFKKGIRSVGIRAAELVSDSIPVQLSVFEDEKKRIRWENLANAIDDIRRRFGDDAIKPAAIKLDPTLNSAHIEEESVLKRA